jgi:hypothetical protein
MRQKDLATSKYVQETKNRQQNHSAEHGVGPSLLYMPKPRVFLEKHILFLPVSTEPFSLGPRAIRRVLVICVLPVAAVLLSLVGAG